jgi:tetratricopeptide (TPR) repeat protein
VQACEEAPHIARIPSWEEEPGECGMHPADLRMDPSAAQAVLQQFVALGYIQPPSENQAKAVESAVREQQYNLARVYLDSRRYQKAVAILEDLVQKSPDQPRFQQHLAQCYLALRRRAEARSVLERLIAHQPAQSAAGKKETEGESPNAASSNQEPKPRPWADLLMGIIEFEESHMDAALTWLLKAEQSDPRLPDLHLRIGETYLRLRRTEDAERAFQQALEIDGDSPEAHLGLAMVRLRQRRNEEAAEQALLAVGLQHFLPLGHFYLGVALARIGHLPRATLAFETSLSMLPGLLPAHRWLAALYGRPDGDLEKAARHRAIFLQMRESRRQHAQA